MDTTKKIKCSECENEFDYQIGDVEVGDIIECPICGANLEIVSMNPIEVAPVTTFK